MSILTQNEREGLEEVFLSIKTSTNRYERVKTFVCMWIDIYLKKKRQMKPKTGISGNFRDKSTKNSSLLSKVKKNLSK